MSGVVEVHDLRMTYKHLEVLAGVDFEVHGGEVVCLLGPNGAGKTTTIEVLEGFRARSSGSVRVLGEDPEHGGDGWLARFGVALQSWRDHARWTPRSLLAHLGGYFAPYATSERPRPWDVDELLATVGLGASADRKIATLSGGQRRRLDVAIGIVGRPELLFLDLSLRSPQDQSFYLAVGAGTLAYLWLNRAKEVEGTGGLLLPTVALPSILAATIAFGIIIGPAYALAMEREDGTLLRLKAVPRGMQGYVAGQVVYHSLNLLPMLLVVVVPSILVFDGLMRRGALGWAAAAGVLVLGLLATLPIGVVIGSLAPSTQKVGTWGMLPVLAVTAISGIFVPVRVLRGWLQVVAQAFPVYWIGLGMRSAFLPDAAAAAELGGSWRTGPAVLVLGAWAIVGLLVAPAVLRRAAPRQSGSQVRAARDSTLQWVR